MSSLGNQILAMPYLVRRFDAFLVLLGFVAFHDLPKQVGLFAGQRLTFRARHCLLQRCRPYFAILPIYVAAVASKDSHDNQHSIRGTSDQT